MRRQEVDAARGSYGDGLSLDPSPVGFDGSTKQIAKNTVYNLLGRFLPMLVAVIAIPIIVRGLGVQRFGVLTLIWLVVGYFGIFDMGIGRATTKFVAEALAGDDREKLPELIWSSLLLLVGLGVVGGGVAALLAPWLVDDVLNIPPELKRESRRAFFLLAASMPLVLGTSGARGVLEGQHRFGLVNAVRVPGSIFTFAGPLLVLTFSNDLFDIVAVLVFGRCVVFFANAYFCISSIPGSIRPRMVRGDMARRLFGFGGWLTVTNIVGALIAFGFIDRFVISSLLDMSAVAYYSVPFEVVTKLLFVPAGFIAVLFPVFSVYAIKEGAKLRRLCRQAIRIVLLCLGPVAFLLIAFSAPGLDLWLGAEFARESALILQLLVAGVLVSSISLALSSAIQALGRPDLTAKRHICQLPVYVAVVWFCTNRWGLTGTAAAWLAWQVADSVILFWLLGRLLPAETNEPRSSGKFVAVGVTGVVLSAGILSAIPNLAVRAVATLVGMALVVIMLWRFGLDEQDKAKVRNLLRVSPKLPGQPSVGEDR